MSICLAMIVKDEEPVISRCIDSVIGHIGSWVIADTGSRDDTRAIALDALHDHRHPAVGDVPGIYVSRKWVDFGHNRSEALDLARLRGDWVLMLDADEELAGGSFPELDPEFGSYMLNVRMGSHTYRRNCLFNSTRKWSYVGALHEYPTCEDPGPTGYLDYPYIVTHPDGVRGRGRTPEDKYLADAKALVHAVEKNPDDARSVFYLAKSYLWAGLPNIAREWFVRRINMTGFAEETYDSLLELAHLAVGDPTQRYLEAWEYRPTRAEPLYYLARYHRLAGAPNTAYLFAERAIEVHRPDDLLWVDEDIYRWRMLDELQIAAYWTGRYNDAVYLAKRLTQLAPDDQLERVNVNLNFAILAAGGE